MTRREAPPRSSRLLERRVGEYARDVGLTPRRVRDWISYMMIAGQLQGAAATASFTIKGGVALEMRLPDVGRATRDIDLITGIEAQESTIDALRNALAGEYQGFTFRVRDDPYVMPNESVRTEIVLEYLGRGWATVRVYLSPQEGDATEVELVSPIDMSPFGFATPGPVPCLSLRYHLAHKIHAMTAPSPDEQPNVRFRDLVDVLLLRPLLTDARTLGAACEHVFAVRAAHTWPPAFEPPPSWEHPFEALSAEVGLEPGGFPEAVAAGRVIIAEAAASAKT